jgi:taurine dioxygenase
MTDTQHRPFELLPLGLTLGADIQGLDLGRDFDQATTDALRAALDRYAVLRFRDIDLPEDDHVRLMSVFGPVTVLTNGKLSSLVSNREKNGVVPHGRLPFHVDLGWTPAPTDVTSLYAIDLELPNEPTMFASASAACAALDESVRQQIAGRTASNVPDASSFRGTSDDPGLLRVSYAVTECTRYPVVMPHPRTGQPILTVSEMLTSEIDGMTADESKALLAVLFAELYRPGNVFTQHWQPRDLVIWDNRGAHHGRTNVKATGNRRTLRKVNTGGAMPRYIGRPPAGAAAGSR